jgi:hypothetical protein
MLRISGAVAVLTLVLCVHAAAQEPQSGLGREDTGAPPVDRSQPTPFQQFVSKLKLDARTQVPAVERVFAAASEEAAPVGQLLLQLRQQMVNVSLAKKPDEMQPVVDAYTAAAARMAGIEARAFAKVYATLRPDQQPRAAQAFAIMAGIFQPAAPRGPGPGGGQRGGGER